MHHPRCITLYIVMDDEQPCCIDALRVSHLDGFPLNVLRTSRGQAPAASRSPAPRRLGVYLKFNGNAPHQVSSRMYITIIHTCMLCIMNYGMLC